MPPQNPSTHQPAPQFPQRQYHPPLQDQQHALPSPTTSTFPSPQTFNANLPQSSRPSATARISTAPAKQTPTASLNPRSCITCRKRKVKCNKEFPCSNCVRGHTECKFPAPGRAPRRPKKPQDGELLARLRKLEGVVQSLGANVNADGDLRDSPTKEKSNDLPAEVPQKEKSQEQEDRDRKLEADREIHGSSIDRAFGRLIIDEGKSRFVSNLFWANLSDEVEDIKSVLYDESADEEDEYHSPASDSVSPSSHHTFIFPSFQHSPQGNLHSLHPQNALIDEYWRLFKQNVDPLLKLMHLPSTEQQIQNFKKNPSSCPKSYEALMFAIYYAAITSISAEETETLAGESRADLLIRYRSACEHALARAGILMTEEVVALQAFVVFMIALRRHEDPRMLWSLTGLAARISVTQGLHRDPKNFGLSPFDTELRRRLWWQVLNADSRLAEDHGTDPTVLEHASDTRIPLNINDNDFQPEMPEMSDREGVTDMTLSIIRYEVANLVRKLNYSPPQTSEFMIKAQNITIEDKERWIEECHQKLEERYLRYCDMSKAMHFVIGTVCRLVLAKMWLSIYQPFQRLDGGASLSQKTRDQLFMTSLESIEYARHLETEVRTVQWGWLFKTYSQWHALAFLLNELCQRTKGPTVLRAWRAVDSMVAEMGSRVSPHRRAHLWRPLRKLMTKARAAREQEVGLDNQLAQSQAQQLAATSCRTPSPLRDGQARSRFDNANPGSYVNLAPGVGASTDANDNQGNVTTAQGEAGPIVAGTLPNDSNVPYMDFGYGLVPEASMPDLALTPSVSRTMLDNVDPTDFNPSPFFANQPQTTRSQVWSDSMNPAMLDDFILGANQYLNAGNTQTAPIAQQMGNMVPGGAFGGGSLSQAPAQGTQSGQPVSSGDYVAGSLPRSSKGMAGQMGLDESSMSWADWDEMVRGLEFETGQNYGVGQARQPQGRTQQQQRQSQGQVGGWV